MTDVPAPLHPLLAARRSPSRFGPSTVCGPADVASLLEAARWAPSAGNSQPWTFVVGVRGDDHHRRMSRYLAPSSAAWAPDAGLLVLNVCQLFVEDTDWAYSEFSAYDLGQAVALMVVQAQALGLDARQFRAFDRDGLSREFSVPAHWQVMSMTAFGAGVVDDGGTRPPRTRRPVAVPPWGHTVASTPST